MSKLRIIGAGMNNVVLTDGTYAIKLGNVSSDEVNELIEAYQYDLGVKVHDYAWRAIVPQEILTLLTNNRRIPVYDNKERSSVVDRILQSGKANILITDLAKPMVIPGKKYSARWHKIVENRVNKLVESYKLKTGKNWWDCHNYNIATYSGHAVIIDF